MKNITLFLLQALVVLLLFCPFLINLLASLLAVVFLWYQLSLRTASCLVAPILEIPFLLVLRRRSVVAHLDLTSN
jgi:hypothetical protein